MYSYHISKMLICKPINEESFVNAKYSVFFVTKTQPICNFINSEFVQLEKIAAWWWYYVLTKSLKNN